MTVLRTVEKGNEAEGTAVILGRNMSASDDSKEKRKRKR
jgi:hypothetical protein